MLVKYGVGDTRTSQRCPNPVSRIGPAEVILPVREPGIQAVGRRQLEGRQQLSDVVEADEEATDVIGYCIINPGHGEMSGLADVEMAASPWLTITTIRIRCQFRKTPRWVSQRRKVPRPTFDALA